MSTPWSASAPDSEPTDRTFADAAASIGAAILALAATARSTGAARSMARSRLTRRSSTERTSLSGRSSPPSIASSSADRRGRDSLMIHSFLSGLISRLVAYLRAGARIRFRCPAARRALHDLMARRDMRIGGPSVAQVGGDGGVKVGDGVGATPLTPDYSVCGPSRLHRSSMNTPPNSRVVLGETERGARRGNLDRTGRNIQEHMGDLQSTVICRRFVAGSCPPRGARERVERSPRDCQPHLTVNTFRQLHER